MAFSGEENCLLTRQLPIYPFNRATLGRTIILGTTITPALIPPQFLMGPYRLMELTRLCSEIQKGSNRILQTIKMAFDFIEITNPQNGLMS